MGRPRSTMRRRPTTTAKPQSTIGQAILRRRTAIPEPLMAIAKPRMSTANAASRRWTRKNVREIARKGGLASHGGRGRDYDEGEDEGEEEGEERRGSSRGSQGTSKRGFAAMEPEERREIARKGGLASHGGQGRQDEEEEEEEEAPRSRSSSRGFGNGHGAEEPQNNTPRPVVKVDARAAMKLKKTKRRMRTKVADEVAPRAAALRSSMPRLDAKATRIASTVVFPPC